jgi:hypothetical protein
MPSSPRCCTCQMTMASSALLLSRIDAAAAAAPHMIRFPSYDGTALSLSVTAHVEILLRSMILTCGTAPIPVPIPSPHPIPPIDRELDALGLTPICLPLRASKIILKSLLNLLHKAYCSLGSAPVATPIVPISSSRMYFPKPILEALPPICLYPSLSLPSAIVRHSASKIGFGKYTRLEEMGTIGGAAGADPRET